jgi:cell division septum initiation protein DivIVA
VQEVPAVDILHLLDQLEEEVATARKMPMGGGVLVDRKRLLDLIDQLRVSIPANIRQARDVMQRREQTLAQADAEAKALLAGAKQEANRLLSEQAVVREASAEAGRLQREAQALAQGMVREAQQKAEQVLAQAQASAQQQMSEADQYALAVLTRIDRQLGAFLGSVRQSVESLQGGGGGG